MGKQRPDCVGTGNSFPARASSGNCCPCPPPKTLAGRICAHAHGHAGERLGTKMLTVLLLSEWASA